MNGAAVGTGSNIDIIAVHVTGNAAYIADDGLFTAPTAASDIFRYKPIFTGKPI